jgi:hypothetical protein
MALRTAPSTLATTLNPEITEAVIKVPGYPIYGPAAAAAAVAVPVDPWAAPAGAGFKRRGGHKEFALPLNGEPLDLDRVIKGK